MTSPGARIKALMEMWLIEYGMERRACDVLLVVGLNNVKNKDDKKIVDRMIAFLKEVEKQTISCHPENPSTFVMASQQVRVAGC
jgi:hypothetical protein